jgi:hypothetical protein
VQASVDFLELRCAFAPHLPDFVTVLMRAMYKFWRGMGDITDAERGKLGLAEDAAKFSIAGHGRKKHTDESALGHACCERADWLRAGLAALGDLRPRLNALIHEALAEALCVAAAGSAPAPPVDGKAPETLRRFRERVGPALGFWPFAVESYFKTHALRAVLYGAAAAVHPARSVFAWAFKDPACPRTVRSCAWAPGEVDLCPAAPSPAENAPGT